MPAQSELNPKILIHYLRVACFMSIADANYIVDRAMTRGWSIIPLLMKKDIINITELYQQIELSGFKVVKYP